MTSDFQIHGRRLLGQGHLIVPIKPGTKSPPMRQWQNVRIGPSDLTRYPNHGVGVLTGQGAWPLSAVDVDTMDPALAAAFTGWCQEHLGATVERIGQEPKIMLVYRAAESGWGKATGAWFEDLAGGRHRLEVLGKGQQFVAHHVHPDTGRPYEWVDLFGGLAEVRASDLPVITEAQIRLALETFAEMAEAHGLARVVGSKDRAGGITAGLESDPLMAFEPPVGLALGEARRLLEHVDNEDYETWLRVGLSLHHEFDGSADALALWDQWSAPARNYAGEEDLARRWDGFGQGGGPPITARWLLKVGHQGRKDAHRAEKRGALAEARDAIEACCDSIDLLGDVAKAAGAAAGDDLALRAELAGLLRARFKDLTDTTLTVAEVRAAMASGRPGDAGPGKGGRKPNTEFGNAERMVEQHGDGLMYVPETDAWYRWTGVYWRRAPRIEVEHLAKETVRALPSEGSTIESDSDRAEFFRFCSLSQKALMVQNMTRLASSDPRVLVSVADLDKDLDLLGVGNGMVDLRTGALKPPDPEARLTVMTEVPYDPNAKAPVFEQTIGEAFWDDKEQVAAFQRLIGYSLMGRPHEDIMAIPHGRGRNGKSTIIGTIRSVLGGHAKTANADTFTTGSAQGGGNAGGPREDLLRLRGIRFIYVTEVKEGSELREDLIKAMTGGDPIPARGIHAKQTVEITPTWTIFMPTNFLPIIKGDDPAIWHRLLTIPFERNFKEDPLITLDPKREEKLAAEAQGILAWCVRGALAYQREGLRPTEGTRRMHAEYRENMDLLSEWLTECCDTGPDLSDTTARLWASWEAWARARGELRLISSARSLGRRLAGKGFRKNDDKKARGWQGLCVKKCGDFE